MSHIHGSIELGAEPSEVWSYVTDPEHFPDFVAGYASGQVLSREPTGVGAEYEWKAALGPLELTTREQVTSWREGEEVRYQGELARTPFQSGMRLEKMDDGGTRLAVDIDYAAPLGPVGAAVLDPLVRHDVQLSLRRLAERFPRTGPSKQRIVGTYRKRAGSYDWETQLYRLVGFPLLRYRRMTADALELRPGDTVVEIGCGTGANLPYLVERVGPSGKVIGVDLTDAMLKQARERVAREGWHNVELVQADAAEYRFPEGVNGIVSTLALTLSPDYDRIVERGARALAPGGHWVVLDLKKPDQWPEWVFEVALWLTRPYCVERESTQRHPWESIQRHLPRSSLRELYFGGAYLAVGSKPAN